MHDASSKWSDELLQIHNRNCIRWMDGWGGLAGVLVRLRGLASGDGALTRWQSIAMRAPETYMSVCHRGRRPPAGSSTRQAPRAGSGTNRRRRPSRRRPPAVGRCPSASGRFRCGRASAAPQPRAVGRPGCRTLAEAIAFAPTTAAPPSAPLAAHEACSTLRSAHTHRVERPHTTHTTRTSSGAMPQPQRVRVVAIMVC